MLQLPSLSGPGIYGSQGVLHIPHCSKTGAPLLDSLVSYPGGVVLCHCSDAVVVFYSPSRLGFFFCELTYALISFDQNLQLTNLKQ